MNISEGGDGGRIGAVHGHMRHQRMAGLIVQLAVVVSQIHYQRIYVIGAKIAYGSPNVGHCYGGAVMFLCCYVFVLPYVCPVYQLPSVALNISSTSSLDISWHN